MAKLHEIIAVESGLQATAKKINEESIRTFNKKDEHFVETTRAVTHFAEDDKKLDTTETKAMVTTVFDRLLYNMQANIRALDTYAAKETTNQHAKADLVVGDVWLATNLPATVFLGLETKLAELRAVYEAIPTLPPGPTWQEDRTLRANGGVYRAAAPDVTFRTKKVVKPVIMAPATEQHPAQVQAIQDDIPIARITTSQVNGMITSAQKSDLLARIDSLLWAVKRARQRANGAEVVQKPIGKVLFDFIHDGIVA